MASMLPAGSGTGGPPEDERARDLDALLGQRMGEQAEDLAALVSGLYDDLHGIAQRIFLEERRGHTLQPTALVHEAYLRLAKDSRARWRNRAEFLGWAARIMRQVLLNHARGRNRKKRGGAAARVPLDDLLISFEECSGEIEAVHEALEELAQLDHRKARIVELRFFGGLTIPEVAEVIGAGQATVERDWRFARAWLVDRLMG